MANWFETLAGATRGRLLALLRRSERPIGDLAAELEISDNAVRMHVSALQRDGFVQPTGVERATGGKPAQLYGITREAEELFPKAYVLVLNELIRTVEAREGREAAVALLREVGRRAAERAGAVGGEAEARVQAAVEALRGLGGDVDVERVAGGWEVRSHGCLLSAVVEEHPEACALAEALVAAVAGAPVREACERGGRPRCVFRVAGGAGG